MNERAFHVTVRIPPWRVRVAFALVRLAIVLQPVAPAFAMAIADRARALATRGVEVVR